MRAHRHELAEARSLKDLSPSSTGGTWGGDLAGGPVGGTESSALCKVLSIWRLGKHPGSFFVRSQVDEQARSHNPDA